MNKKIFTKEEEMQICEEYKKKGLNTIGREYGIRAENVKGILLKHNIKIRRCKLIKYDVTHEEKIQMREDYRTMSLREVAKSHCLRVKTAKNILISLGTEIRSQAGPFTILSDEDIENICEDYKNNTVRVLARKYKISDKRVAEIAASHGIKIRRRDEGVIRSIITEDDERDICKAYLQGAFQNYLGRKYHVDLDRIKDILKKNNIRIETAGERKLTKISKEDEQLICKNYLKYYNISFLAKEFHTNKKKIIEILTNNNIKICNKNIYRGQSITEEICKRIDKNSDIQGTTLLDLINPTTGRKLNPDIWMPKYNTMVEYDGIQHYEPIYGEEQLEYSKYRDYIKNKYCNDHGYLMIRIDSRDFGTDKKRISEYIINKLKDFGYDV